ncbi:MAG: hypothetical protein JRS35_01080 [Deltaproteobacteria bacterium]|nr:hypothetical protein [Deltaproteobacteria bacterium]
MQHDVQTPMHPRGGPPPLGFAALPRWLVLVLFAVVAISVAAAHWPALSAEATMGSTSPTTP